MNAIASSIQPELTESFLEAEGGLQVSRVYLKAPCPEPPNSSEPDLLEAPSDFVAFLGEQQGLDAEAAFALLCQLLSNYQTPVRREIVLL